jgi:hypothetical protein
MRLLGDSKGNYFVKYSINQKNVGHGKLRSSKKEALLRVSK